MVQLLTPNFYRSTLLDPWLKKVAFGLQQNANDKTIIKHLMVRSS